VSLRPTVIGTQGPPAAAPAPEAAPATLRPTVIGPTPATPVAAESAPAPRATALPSGLGAPAPAAAPAAVAPAAITKVRGTERRGLLVEAAALRERHPQVTESAVEQAVALLAGVVPDTFAAKSVESLGRAAQDGVARLVDRVLRLVDQEPLRATTRHVERLHEVLQELAEALEPAALPWRRRNLRQALAEIRPELDGLRDQLQNSETLLTDHRDRLSAMQGELQQTADALQGTLIALAELRGHFNDDRRLAALDHREAELLKSTALLQQHALQLHQLDTAYAQMAQRLRDAVLHALPAWLSLAATMPADQLNDTQRFSLLDPLRSLMLTLKPSRN
jgi:uncharacterized protein YaaN involved in tellurite resistance